MRLPEPTSILPSVRDALAAIHQQTLELIVRGASLDAVLDALWGHAQTNEELVSAARAEIARLRR